LSETWCNANVTNAFLNIAGYNFQTELRNDRCDTANGVGGGLAVYTTNGLTVLPCDKASDFNQYCKFKIVNGCDVVYFYLLYRPPSSGQDSKDKICELFRAAEKNSVFFGDFNLPDIDWQTGAAGSRASDAIVEAATAAGLRQLVEFPTHTRGNVLDLVITNVPERVENVREGGRVGRSDHVVVQCELAMVRNSSNRIKVKNWNKAEWTSIRDGIKNTAWPTTTDGTTAEEAWQQLRDRLEELTAAHVPEREFRERSSDWMTRDILQLIRKKRRLWKKAKYGQNVAEYEEVTRLVSKKIRTAKRQMEQRLAKDKSGNKKPFYNYIRKKTRAKENVGPLKKADGSTVTDPEEMAEELNKCFSDVFTREDGNAPPAARQHNTRTRLTKTFITAQKVRKKIKELKPTGAAGPDGISTKLLQNCVEEISPVLAVIYRKSMASGTVPAEWKTANVVPIHKKGSKAAAGNYRPISLTCISCKVMESIIKDDIVDHLRRNKIIASSQHGFTKGRSCTTNLLEFMEVVTKAADSGKAVDIVYLDFAKAFDKVPIKRLITKLSAAGIRGNVLSWIKDWLTDRKQRVVVNGKFSGWRAVLSGVPQGSVLGPILFNIFINDLDDAATARQLLKKFADDTKVGQVIENQGDAQELQSTLDKLCEWAATWGMTFNVDKCHVMHVGRHNIRAEYKMNGIRLASTTKERDVGVIICDNLKQAEQCKKAAQTASTVLAQIQRAFHYRDRNTYVGLYKQYVRPHLEFATPAWAPGNQGDIDTLERVQERAVRAVSGLRGRTYSERLLELGLPTLAQRREEADMIMTFKLLSDSENNYSAKWFEKMATRRPTRNAGGRDNLIVGRADHNYRRQFFSLRVPAVWNGLPDQVKEAATVSAFKTRLRKNFEERVARTNS
jgi:hypothetical protein